MAEAEDVITDAALHATNFVQGVWRRHRANAPAMPALALADIAQHLDLLIVAVFGRSYRLRTAQAAARATFLARTFQRQQHPRVLGAIPATDGACIWLPAETGLMDTALALARFRTVALQQAMRAHRGSAAGAGSGTTPLVRDLYLLIEAHAADAELSQLLPGMRAPLDSLRAAALSARPVMSSFPFVRQPIEAWVRRWMALPSGVRGAHAMCSPSPERSLQMALAIANEIQLDAAIAGPLGTRPVFKDWWTGELLEPGTALSGLPAESNNASGVEVGSPSRSAWLARRPKVREATDDEDDTQRAPG